MSPLCIVFCDGAGTFGLGVGHRASAAGATFHLVPAKPVWNCFVQRMGGHARNRLDWEGEADAPLPLAADEDFESEEDSEQHLRAALEASRKEY